MAEPNDAELLGYKPGATIQNMGDQDASNANTNNPKDLNSQPDRHVRCKTCDSTQNCEEDIDNPGDFYCRCCWDEYTVKSQQEQVVNGQLQDVNTCSGVEKGSTPLGSGAHNTQSLPTQSQSEFDRPQTQAMSMTQPQTQPLVENEQSQKSLSKFDADENLSKIQFFQHLNELVG
jgi:hypothetical protein